MTTSDQSSFDMIWSQYFAEGEEEASSLSQNGVPAAAAISLRVRTAVRASGFCDDVRVVLQSGHSAKAPKSAKSHD